MTALVRQMVDLAPALAEFDTREALLHSDRGIRLAGYAKLYANPEFTLIEEQVASLTEKEDNPFGQYWGLKALSWVLAARGDHGLPSAMLKWLQDFGQTLGR